MDKEVYLHIGMPKTGSSALQAFFALNVEALQKEGIYYPDPARFNQAFQTSSGNGDFLIDLLSKKNTNEIQKFIHEKLELTQNILLFSSEHLFHIIRVHHEFVFSSLRDFNIKIVIYVRRQDELFSSVYNQTVKNHNDTSLDSNSISKYHDFAEVLMNIKNYLPVDRIIVRPYEIEQFNQNNIYDDFCNIIGVKRNTSFILPEPIVNPSLSPSALEYRRLVNFLKLNSDHHITKNQLNALLADYTVKLGFGKPFSCDNIFSAKERMKIIQKYQQSNDAIARIFLSRPNGGLFKKEMNFKSKNSLKKVKRRDLKKITKYLYQNNKELTLDIYRHLKLNENNISASEAIAKLLPVYEVVIHDQEQRKIIAENEIADDFQKNNHAFFNNMRLLCTINFSNFNQFIKSNDSDNGLIIKTNDNAATFQLNKCQAIALKPVMGNYNSQTYVKIIIDSSVVSSIECRYATRANPNAYNANIIVKEIGTGRNEIYFLITNEDFNGNIRIVTGRAPGVYSFHEIELKTNSKTYYELLMENKRLKNKLTSLIK